MPPQEAPKKGAAKAEKAGAAKPGGRPKSGAAKGEGSKPGTASTAAAAAAAAAQEELKTRLEAVEKEKRAEEATRNFLQLERVRRRGVATGGGAGRVAIRHWPSGVSWGAAWRLQKIEASPRPARARLKHGCLPACPAPAPPGQDRGVLGGDAAAAG